jgi:hypothetical protein
MDFISLIMPSLPEKESGKQKHPPWTSLNNVATEWTVNLCRSGKKINK